MKNIMERFPPEIAGIFCEKGILPENVKNVLHADVGQGLEFCDVWVVHTEDEIAVLETLGGIFEKKKKNPLGLKRSDTGRKELSWRVFSLDEWEFFRVEEFVSGGRITARSKSSGENHVITNFSNTFKDEAFEFSSLVNGTDSYVSRKERERAGEQTPPPRGPGGPGRPRPMREGKSLKELNTKGLLKKMMPFISKYKKETALVLLMVIFSALLSVLSPFISGSFFYDEVLSEKGDFYGEIFFAIFLIAGTKLLSVIFEMVHSIVTAKVSARVTYDLKKTIFSAIQRLSLSYFNMRQSGGIMTQINQDSTSIYWFFVDGLPNFIVNIVKLVTVSIILFSMNWRMSIIVMIPIPVFLIFRSQFVKVTRKLHARAYSQRRRFSSFISDVLVGTRVVKAFSGEKIEQKKFNGRNYALADTISYNTRKINWIANIIPSVMEIGTWTVWALGGMLVVMSKMPSGASSGLGLNITEGFTYGSLVTYIAMISMAYSPLDFFNRFTRQLSECMNAMYRLFEILEKKSEVAESENPIIPESSSGEVEFRHVSFEYQPGHKVIDNVSFKVSKGETIGIVGHTGAGKSTLVNLVMRLYDAVSGEVLVDGVNVKDLPISYIRDRISIVSQETYVFSGTIADNIRYAVPDASDDEVIAAARAAGAHDFIIKYPDGYNTKIGTGARSLSGGELQRVSIARAILKNPKILILDEATAAMDTATELRIQNAITEITRDKTTIIIAHRLSTLRDADRLVVIEDGKMTEEGTHAELVKRKGSYYKLYKMQMDALKIIGVEE